MAVPPLSAKNFLSKTSSAALAHGFHQVLHALIKLDHGPDVLATCDAAYNLSIKLEKVGEQCGF
jgi:hypothetical protein